MLVVTVVLVIAVIRPIQNVARVTRGRSSLERWTHRPLTSRFLSPRAIPRALLRILCSSQL
jgi:hypothetical protein